MQGVGTGRVIAGRYGLQERRAHQGELEVWSGTDTIAHRPVSITIFPVSIPRADAALDAARRSAVVDDPRLVAVLDVGSDHAMAWIVEESLADSSTLANLLQHGPLGADEARRIAGEVSSALDVAARRGLHHLHLSPYAVRRTDDGRIKLAGLATAAAIEGTEEPDSEQAAQVDTVGVLAVLYSALTARWPLDDPMPGLATAPRIVGGVAAPSELTAGVPPDLDLLCRTVLNGQAGPATPGQLAAQIAPWADHAVDATAPVGGSDASTAPLFALETPQDPAPGDQSAAALGAGGPGVTDPSTAAAPAATPAEPATLDQSRSLSSPSPPRSPATHQIARTDAESGVASASSRAAGSAAATASAVDGPGPETPSVGDRVGGAWRAARSKADALRTQLVDSAGSRIHDQHAEAGQRVRLDQALEDGRSSPLPPPTPIGPTAVHHQDGEHARLVLGIVSGLLVLAMLIAVPTLFRSATSTAAPTTTTVATRPPTPGAGATRSAVTPLPIQSATGFDPLGDGSENGSQARRSYDGDSQTAWTSEGYRGSPALGGTKDGVGVIYTLAPGSKVSTAQLTLASRPQDVTVYVSTDRSLDGAQEVGKVTNATGQQTVRSQAPLTGRYVIVWFTKAAAEEGDRYRCSLAEVAFS